MPAALSIQRGSFYMLNFPHAQTRLVSAFVRAEVFVGKTDDQEQEPGRQRDEDSFENNHVCSNQNNSEATSFT